MSPKPKTPEKPADCADTTPLPSIDVRALVGQGREAVIVHNGDRYRLRITANGKLILTK